MEAGYRDNNWYSFLINDIYIGNVWHGASFKIKELVSWFGLSRCKFT